MLETFAALSFFFLFTVIYEWMLCTLLKDDVGQPTDSDRL
jgi:hypothetical protein